MSNFEKKHAIIAIMKSPTGAIVGVGRPRARGRGPRGSIEISKCLNVTNSRGSRVEFRERGDRFATLLECFLNFLSASYLDQQCMDSGKMSQFETRLSSQKLASPQTSFGVRLSRIHFSPTWGRNECVTNEPQRTSAGRLHKNPSKL